LKIELESTYTHTANKTKSQKVHVVNLYIYGGPKKYLNTQATFNV